MTKTYSGADIDIFVLTHNREKYLTETLESLLNQTVSGLKITVLDNASTDNTAEAVQSYISDGVRYLRAEVNVGWKGNFKRAQELSSREWTFLFHDDDILHPEYFVWVLEQINSRRDVVLLGCSMLFEASPLSVWPPTVGKRKVKYCRDQAELAELLYQGFPLCFPGTVYRTDVLKKLEWEDDLYGKIADRPLLIEMMRHGSGVISSYPFVKYRKHSGQDSSDPNSGPFVEQIAALHALYLRILGKNAFDRHGRAFLLNNSYLLRNDFKNLCPSDSKRFTSYSDFWRYVYNVHGASRLSRYFLGFSRILNIRNSFVALARVFFNISDRIKYFLG